MALFLVDVLQKPVYLSVHLQSFIELGQTIFEKFSTNVALII